MSEPVDPNAYPPPSWPPPSPPPSQPPGYPPSQGFPSPQGYPAQGYPAQPGYPPSQGYPAPGWPAQGYPAPGYPAPTSPSPRRRRALVIATVAVVILGLVGVVVYFAVGSGSSRGTHLAVPGSFAGYTQLHNDIATRVETTMRDFAKDSGGAAGAQLIQAATIAVYSHDTGDQPVLITLVMPTSAAGTSATSDAITAELLSGATTDAGNVAPGSHGGSAQCGDARFGMVQETMCAWSDARVSGMLVSINESKTTADLAALMRTFRDSVE